MARVAAASRAIPAGSDRHLPRPVGSLRQQRERRSPRVHATHKAATLWDVQPLRTRLYEKTCLEPLTETEGIPGTCTPTHAGVGGAGHPRRPGPQLPRQPSGAGGGSEPPHPRLAPNISERHGSERRALGPTRAAARPRRELQFTAGLGDDAAGGAGGAEGTAPPASPAFSFKREAARWTPGPGDAGMRWEEEAPGSAEGGGRRGHLPAGSARRLRCAREQLCGEALAHRGDPAAAVAAEGPPYRPAREPAPPRPGAAGEGGGRGRARAPPGRWSCVRLGAAAPCAPAPRGLPGNGPLGAGGVARPLRPCAPRSPYFSPAAPRPAHLRPRGLSAHLPAAQRRKARARAAARSDQTGKVSTTRPAASAWGVVRIQSFATYATVICL